MMCYWCLSTDLLSMLSKFVVEVQLNNAQVSSLHEFCVRYQHTSTALVSMPDCIVVFFQLLQY
jgi:hypothetical protein